MLKQITVDQQQVSAYMQNRQRIPLTVMSFDVDVHELVIPILGVEPNQITQVIAVFNLKRAKSTVQVFGEVKEDKVHIKLPIHLNRYKGRFGIEVDLRMTDNATLTLAQFEAESRRSDIDANNVELLPYYFKLFDELVTEVQTKRTDALDEITTEANDAILEISEQVRLTGLAETAAIQNINEKVELVETTKKAALAGINEQVESVEAAKGLAVDAINDEKTLAINAISQAGTLAIGNVEAAEGSAIGAINQKVTNVDNVKKDAVTAIDEDVNAVSNLKTNALQSIADDTQSASNSLATINGYQQTASNAVTAIDGHLANTTAKNELVNQKYSEFDADITVAGQTIDEILALKAMNLYYDETLGEYVNLNWFYQSQKNGKVYTTEFYNYSVSPSSSGLKKDANAGLVAEPSTNTYAGRDDYMDIALFKPLDVNGYVDENDDYHVTAIKGDGRFKNDGSNGDVWVMNMTGFVKRFEAENTWGYSYSDVMQPGFSVVPGGRKLDGTIRPYILRAKYPAVRNPHDDNKLASISGQNPEYVAMSHNGQITEFKKKGAQYSGKTSHDDFWAKLMIMIKYASTNSDAIGNGCNNYNPLYAPSVTEENQSRFIVTNAQANNILVGSCVSIGDLAGTTVTDRNDARLHNVRNRVKVASIEPLPDGVNSAINLDTTPFNVTDAMRIITMPWGAGACDNVLGVDGSPFNVKSDREPLLINGIELMHGAYEVIQNVMIYNDNTNPNDYQIKTFICYDCTKYATSATADYQLISKRLAQTNNSWQYIATCEVDPLHPSVMIPTATGAASSTGFGDGIYTNPAPTGYREWLSLGNLSLGLLVGAWHLNGNFSLSAAHWHILGRLSATGRSRGEGA